MGYITTTNLPANQSVGVIAQFFGWDSADKVRNSTYNFGYTIPNIDNSNGVQVFYRYVFLTMNLYNYRNILQDYDLSSIDGTIIGLNLKLFGRSVTGVGYETSPAIILEGDWTEETIIVDNNDEFTGFDSGGWDGDDTVEYSAAFGGDGWSTSGYNTITLNSDAVAAANSAKSLTGDSRLRFYFYNHPVGYGHDDTGWSTWPQYYALNFYAQTDATNPPILEVTYTIPDPGIKIKSGNLTLKSGQLTIK